VVAATNRNLLRMVGEGKFREDLYYRLNLFPVALPALRERPADILPLATAFFQRAKRRLGKPLASISPEAAHLLRAYHWPGNVRELENTMERAAILSEGDLLPGDLPGLVLPAAGADHSLTAAQPAPGSAKTVRELEKEAILAALKANHGNRTRSAAQLGISLRTLQYRLKEYGLGDVE
jgi:transcriptional regulator with PAS, ATPase and Fis domain